MKTIAFYSPKGGVGKTASAVNIAYLDPQGAASFYLHGSLRSKGKKISKLLDGRLTEQVLKVVDLIYVPLVPTWLSLNSWYQFQELVKDKKLGLKKLRPFFTLVDRRKKLQELCRPLQ